MANEQSEGLLHDLGALLGLALSFDESDQCLIALDDDLYISIQSFNEAWVFYGMLGNLDSEIQPLGDESLEREAGLEDQISRGKTAETLLALNLSMAEAGGASIALQQDTGVVMLVQCVGLPGVTAPLARDALEKFANQQSAVIRILNGDAPPVGSREPGLDSQGAISLHPSFI